MNEVGMGRGLDASRRGMRGGGVEEERKGNQTIYLQPTYYDCRRNTNE